MLWEEIEYRVMGVCLCTRWECEGVDKRDKEAALYMGKVVGLGRSLKMGGLGKCNILPSAQLESGFEGA